MIMIIDVTVNFSVISVLVSSCIQILLIIGKFSHREIFEKEGGGGTWLFPPIRGGGYSPQNGKNFNVGKHFPTKGGYRGNGRPL